MVLTYSEFIIFFPELSTITQPLVESKIVGAEIESNGYVGVASVPRQKYMLGLLTAHLLELDSLKAKGASGAVSSVKSNNDSITYAVSASTVAYSLGSTGYGQQLERMLGEYSVGFCV